MRSLGFLVLAISLISLAPALRAADMGHVTGMAQDLDELELYATPDAETPARTLTRAEVAFPLPILEVSDNGMYHLRLKGGDFWVISDDVLSDRGRAVEGGCEPKMASAMVAHGKRGAGEGCK